MSFHFQDTRRTLPKEAAERKERKRERSSGTRLGLNDPRRRFLRRVSTQSAKLTGAFIISVDKAYTHLVNGTMSPFLVVYEAAGVKKGKMKEDEVKEERRKVERRWRRIFRIVKIDRRREGNRTLFLIQERLEPVGNPG